MTENEIYESAMAKFKAESEKMISLIEDYITGEKFIDEIAMLLIYAGDEKSRGILQKVPADFAEKIKTRVDEFSKSGSALKNDSPKVLSSVGSTMRKLGFYGEDSVKGLIDSLTLAEETCMNHKIDDFFAVNPLLAMNAEENFFEFRDILLLDDRSIQKVLRETESTDLAIALKSTDEEVQDKIYKNMSRRAAALLKEDIEFMGPVRLSDVDEMQSKIVAIIRKLERNGEIIIARTSLRETVV